MLSFTTKILVILLSLFMFFACNDAIVNNDFEIVISDNLKLGENLVLTVNDENKLIDYEWKLKYELGNSLTSCDSFYTSKINCSLEESGEVSIMLNAKTRDGDDVTLYRKVNVLDMDLPLNQAPIITVSLDSENSDESIVSSNRSLEKGTLNFKVNEEVTFNFSQTADDTDLNTDLKYEIQLDKDAAFQEITPMFKYTFTKTGYFTITLKVTDKDENTAVKTFVAFISCNDNEVNLVVDADKVIITPDGIHNFFTYDASSAVSGGDSTTYRFRWDYNGDGIYDTDWLEENSIKEYNVFRGERNVKLKVWEQACNNVKEVILLNDFVIPFADAIPGNLQGPQIPGYFFIQGHPEGKDGFESTITDVDFIATKANSSPPEEQWRVLCDYRPNDGKATISIKGLNQYKRLKEDGELHGVLLTLDDIDISGFGQTITETTTLSNLTANVDKLNYYSDEEYDKLSRVVYRKDGNCVSQLTLTVLRGEGSCAGAASTFSDVILIDGTYSCENLKGTNDKNISFKKGAFYCEVGKGDACVGGGGGGGGNPPEEF